MATASNREENVYEEIDFGDSCYKIENLVSEPASFCNKCGNQPWADCLTLHKDTVLTKNHRVSKIKKKETCDMCNMIHKVLKEPTNYCDECDHVLCDDCLNYHRQTTKNHTVSKLTTVEFYDSRYMNLELEKPSFPCSVKCGYRLLDARSDLHEYTHLTSKHSTTQKKSQQKEENVDKNGKGKMKQKSFMERFWGKIWKKEKEKKIDITKDNTKQEQGICVQSVKTKYAKLEHSILVSRENDIRPCEIKGFVLLNDKFIVSDNSNSKLKVFDSAYRFLYEFNCENEPLDIDMLDKDKVVVSSMSGCNINLLSVGNENMNELVQISTGCKCGGVCCYEGHIYCVVRDIINSEKISKVCNYTPDGKLKWVVANVSDGRVHCKNLQFITVDPKTGILFVTDYYKGVVALTKNGDVITVFSHYHLEGPQGIAVDERGQIHVCGMNSNNVVRLSNIGNIGVEILSNHDTCEYAQCVRIKGKLMFLACRHSNVISMYELEEFSC